MPQTDLPDPLLGQLIAERYRIIDVLARGAMGVVYRAKQLASSDIVAIKMTIADNDTAWRQFRREAAACIQLSSPHTIKVLEVGEHRGQPYLAMELLTGKDLGQLLRDGPLEPLRAAGIAVQVLQSLDEAHARSIIHCDIKPDNIFLPTTPDGSDMVKVLDFGLAKLLGSTEETLVRSGMVVGTPLYMSPEQAEDKPLDARSDLYSLGVVLYEMLAGAPPFMAPDPVGVLIKHVTAPPQPIALRRPDIWLPRGLEEVVFRVLRKDPNARFATAGEMICALASAMEGDPTGLHSSMEMGIETIDLYASSAAIRVAVASSSSYIAPRPQVTAVSAHRAESPKVPRVLIVDHQPASRTFLSDAITHLAYDVVTADSGAAALEILGRSTLDIVLIDTMMPNNEGFSLLKTMRDQPDFQDIPVVVVTAHDDVTSIEACLEAGALDYLIKPFAPAILATRLKGTFAQKHLRDQTNHYRTLMEAANLNLEQRLRERTQELARDQAALVFALTTLLETRDPTNRGHAERLGAYCVAIARALQQQQGETSEVDDQFVELLSSASALHDIGMVGLPDAIVHKPGPLSDSEHKLIQTHPELGRDVLLDVLEKSPDNELIQLGRDIVLYHHERWDGTGYPAGLSGDTIPLCARIVAVADVYDALTTDRPYRKANSHERASEALCKGRGELFDPEIIDAFMCGSETIKRIRQYAPE